MNREKGIENYDSAWTDRSNVVMFPSIQWRDRISFLN
jgi:hypothetical protein